MVWRDNNKDLDFCSVCNTSRWKDSNTPGKKVPKKVLRYFPIIPRLQRLYKSSHTVKEMIWHATGKCTEPGKMQHPVDGGAWKKFDTKYPDFAKEPRNVRLGLAADGFNPFGNLSQAYSMWPMILTTYNLPPPLIEDLKVLWDRKGVETIDVASGQKFNMRAMVLWTINDFPARTYVGHIRFLKKPHKWRSSREFNGETENGDPPREFSRDAIMTQLDRLPTRVKGKHPRFGGVKIKRNVPHDLADIIDVVDEDDDIIDEEDPIPYDLADSDDEDLVNLDIDDGKGKRKPNLGCRGAGRLNTRDKTRNLSLKEITETKGLVSIHFDVGDKQTLNPLSPHAAHWSNYIGEVVRSVPLYYPSWEKVPKERKAALISNIGTLFDLMPHMESSRWIDIYEGINMHLQKAYNTNKASFKAKHWKVDPQTRTYDVEAIRRARSKEITADEIRSLARLRETRQASDTQEYPSLIDTFWRTHTVDGVFLKDEDRRIYEGDERGLEATGEYTEDEINRLAREGKLGGHILGVGRVLPSRATSRPSMPAPDKSVKGIHKKRSGGVVTVEESGDDE
ncbi:F-box domain containing protein [Tanacetum coccineum]